MVLMQKALLVYYRQALTRFFGANLRSLCEVLVAKTKKRVLNPTAV